MLESVRDVSDPFLQDEAVDGTFTFTKPELPSSKLKVFWGRLRFPDFDSKHLVGSRGAGLIFLAPRSGRPEMCPPAGLDVAGSGSFFLLIFDSNSAGHHFAG